VTLWNFFFIYIYSTPFIPTRRLPNGIEEAQSEEAGQEAKGQEEEAEIGAQEALSSLLAESAMTHRQYSARHSAGTVFSGA
jgi:hypothetical protein